MKRVAITTLGCKVNQYETSRISAQFNRPGYRLVPFEEEADIYIINTCTVTQRADHRSRQSIRAAIKRNPAAFIVVTGCYVERCPSEIVRIEGVDLILDNQKKSKIREAIEEYIGLSSSDSPPFTSENLLPLKTRAMVKIQDGCDRFCAYCILPYIRGRSRSRPPEDVLAEILTLVNNGFKEVVLCGINLGSYGHDSRMTLSQLIRKIEGIDGLRRIRLSSLEPDLVDEEIIKILQNSSKVTPHLHIPLQSGDDEILSKMNRRYSTRQFRDLTETLKQQIREIAITTDVIVGFPGEDEGSFQRTYRFIEEMGFSNLHIFKYSAREGTEAFRLGDVPEERKRERAQLLAGLKKRLNLNHRRKYLGQVVEILTEAKECDTYTAGLTPQYVRVFLKGGAPVNEILKVKVEEVTSNFTRGKLLR